jgi:hypothetical protein
MKCVKAIPTALAMVCILFTACDKIQPQQAIAASAAGNVVTEDIQAGIENHIKEYTRRGGGYFRLNFGGSELMLKLVRVHTEYLANLAPGRHFACVDLANVDGDVYDVDFFLEGDPGAMTVTETIVHKLNGKPYYVWKQLRDGTWKTVPAEGAPPKLLGVIEGTDRFEFIYRAKLPRIKGSGSMWLPMPETDSYQTIEVISIDAPDRRQILRDNEYGNSVLLIKLGPADSGETIEMRFAVQRIEKAVYAEEVPSPEKYLKPEKLVPANGRFSSIAEEVVRGKDGDLVRARALYDHTIKRMRYMKYGSGWGKGDAVYACDARTGNCTDFHSYFIALVRSVGIPARFAIGASIPSERNSGGIDGYHCWAEFYTDGKWWPVDISEGNKCSSLSTYFFGHHPANRIELSRGRDLVLDPGPESGPINFLAYPVLEIDGKTAKAKVEFLFERKS